MKTNQQLQLHYYCLYALLLALLVLVHFSNDGMPLWSLSESLTMMTSTVNILFLLAIPLVFKLFSIKVKHLTSIQTYATWALVQMYAIAFPALTSIAVYALLRDTTALYCYLIAFVSLVFCKPTRQKWEYYEKEVQNEE